MTKAPLIVHQLDYAGKSLPDLWRLIAFIRTHNIKFIYLTDKPFFCAKYGALRLAGVKRIVVHDHTPGERTVPQGAKLKLKVLRNRLTLFTADAYIAVSRLMRNRHIESECVPGHRSYLVVNGIVPIDRDASLADYCSKEFKTPNGAVVVFTSGRASPYKQIDFIIRCAARLIHELHYDVFFLYCGDGPDLANLVELAKALSLEDRFIFAGKRNDVRQIAQSCHIGMQASKGEGFSLSILEYMSAGLATVVPDSPSVCQAISDGRTGLLYRADDIESACQTIGRLIGDPDLRQRLGSAAMQTVHAQYNLAATNIQLRSVIEELCVSTRLATAAEKA